MAQILILAPNKMMADMVARGRDLPPNEWRYITDFYRLTGRNSTTTMLIYRGASGLDAQKLDIIRHAHARDITMVEVDEEELRP